MPSTITIPMPTPAGSLPGLLMLPTNARGMVLFAHGSGSDRFSPRNQYVASVLHRAPLATLLFDLLTERETADRRNVFDIPLLADRLLATIRWASYDPRTSALPLGLFGASTGAGAALVAAAREPRVAAVVSRGGRPDLAADSLDKVTAPTLLIVGADDPAVIEMNREAFERLRCTKEITIVPGASHLFEEPGTLEQVAHLARDWFTRYLAPNTTSP